MAEQKDATNLKDKCAEVEREALVFDEALKVHESRWTFEKLGVNAFATEWKQIQLGCWK